MKNKEILIFIAVVILVGSVIDAFNVSSVIVPIGNKILTFNFISPDNSSSLASGENVYLNFTFGDTLKVSYSLDNQSIVHLGEGAGFAVLLNGSLPYGILSNTKHFLSINGSDDLGNFALVNYSFSVNDILPPNLALSIVNNSRLYGTSSLLEINLKSGEYANVSYMINSNPFSDTVDLGAAKSKTINLSVSAGQNNLTINASDFHNNINIIYFSFNYSLCHDAIQNGDETGIDCGGGCAGCIDFDLSTDRQNYNLTDIAYLSIISRAGSTVNVTVMRDNFAVYSHIFIPVFAGAPIAETRIIGNTATPGNYTVIGIMNYLNTIETKNITFNVLSPPAGTLAVTINANATEINEGNPILFSSSVSGNRTPVSYKWDFESDGIIDGTSPAEVYTYPSNGTYSVNLTVSDLYANQSAVGIITVKKLFNVTIIVKDNTTFAPIENAQVEFDNELQETSGEGILVFLMNAGRYSLNANKQGYIKFSNRTEVNGNDVFEIYLAQQDSISPLIQPISPNDKATLSNNSVVLRYKAVDKSRISCSLYMSLNESQLKLEGIDNAVKSDAESFFVSALPDNGTYQWQIGCVDGNGNSNFSEIRTFTVNEGIAENKLSIDLDAEDQHENDIMSEIDNAIGSIAGFSAEEKEAADEIRLKDTLEKAKIFVQRANRDLHSLKWRKLNATGLEEETKKILQSVEDLRDTTPAKIEVADKNEFVKYPNKEDVSRILQYIINSTNRKISKKEFGKILEDNFKLQSLITVTTKAKMINLESISGKKNSITLIRKIIEGDKNITSMDFFELIPKEFSKNITDMELLFDYEIIDSDPVIKIDIGKFSDFSYYTKKRLSLVEAEKIKSVVMRISIDTANSGSSPITGFAVFSAISKTFSDTTDARLAVELAVILILISVFLYYQFAGSGKLKYLLKGRDFKEMIRLMDSAEEKIMAKKYDEASLVYKSIRSKFAALNKKNKDFLKSPVVELINRINMLYINQLVEKANEFVKSNNKKEVKSIYLKIKSLYSAMPKSCKGEVSKKCLELYKQL